MNKNELIKRLKEQESAHQVDDYSEGFDDGIALALELAVRLDESEVLSQKWIDERKRLGHFQSGDGIYFGYFIKADDLQNPLVPKQDEPQKVVIPQFVGDWIDEYKDQGYTLSNAIFNISRGCEDSDIEEYFRENPRTFIDAWDNGYTVEKEQKYILSINITDKASKTNYETFLNKRGIFHSMENKSFNSEEFNWTEEEIRRLTKGDILFEHFAVNVEELEE